MVRKIRYYQQIAVQKTIEVIASGKPRVLLTLATGTGKTYIAFEIVYRLFESRWSKYGVQKRPRVLFLADEISSSTKPTTSSIHLSVSAFVLMARRYRRNGKVPTNANIFFAIYQAISERKSDEADSENDFSGYFKPSTTKTFLTSSSSTSVTVAVQTSKAVGVIS